MAVLPSTDFLAIQFPQETPIVVDPGDQALSLTIPALHSFMTTFDVEFVGPVMIMRQPQQKLSGFVCNRIATLT